MDEIISFVNYHHEVLLMSGAAAVLVLTIGYGLHKAKKVPGEEPMKKETYVLTKRQQRRQESSHVADGIEALLLDMFSKGHITEDRYNAWHTRFVKRMGLIDLQNKPIVLTSEMKKKNSKARIAVLKAAPKPKLVKEVKKPKNAIEAALQAAV
jgi:hypothetical protein